MARSCNFILCALLLLAAGCQTENPPVGPDDSSLYGNVSKPEWTATESYDMTSSMTAIVKVGQLNDLTIDPQIVNNEDLLAAFAGDVCLGVASPQDGLFFLYIAGTEGTVTLAYYSAHYRNLFYADPIPFRNDANLGSLAAPFSPVFNVEKK